MPTLNIGGRKVTVDDSFLTLPPEQQSATVEEIASSFGGAAQPAAATPPAPPDARPWYQKAAQGADDLVRLAANGMTFGYADKLAGSMEGTGVEAERAKSAAAQERQGLAGTAAEIGGAITTPVGLASAGVTALKLAPKAVTGIKGLLTRTGLMAGEGAAYGALGATGHDTDVTEGALHGLMFGAAGNVAGEGVSKGVQKVAAAFNKKPVVPTVEELKVGSQKAYQAADDAGVIFSPQGMQRLKSNIEGDLANFGYHPKLQPNVAVVLEELGRVSKDNISLKGVDVLRRIADSARGSIIPSEKKLGNKIIDHIDDFVTDMKPGDVVMGDAKAGAAAVKEARDLWSRMRKVETVAQAVTKAEHRAGSTGSGGNVDNATRQNLRGILDNPKKSRGFTADEKAALEKAVMGTSGQNLARLIGKMSPTGNGLMQTLHAGGALASGGATIPLAITGYGAKKVADRATPQNVEELTRIILGGGKKSNVTTAPNAVERLAQSKREALARILMSTGLAVGPQ